MTSDQYPGIAENPKTDKGKVIGYRDFMNKKNLIVTEPEELSV